MHTVDTSAMTSEADKVEPGDIVLAIAFGQIGAEIRVSQFDFDLLFCLLYQIDQFTFPLRLHFDLI